MKKEKSSLRILTSISVLALVLLLAVGSTFSWYNRSAKTANAQKLRYSVEAKVSAQGEKTITTYVGTSNNGNITYDTELPVTRQVTLDANKMCYFKTVITETDNAGDSILSLYAKTLTCSTNMGNKVNIGIFGPEKTYKQYSGTNSVFSTVCIEDNVFVKSEGTVEIYWFVKSNQAYSGDATVTLGDLYIMYD